jgi:hypothetical protein
MTKEQVEVYRKIAKQFKLKADSVKKIFQDYLDSVGHESRVMDVEVADTSFYFGVSKNTAKVNEMLVYDKFKKTALYADAIDLIENSNVGFVVFFSGNTLMTLYPSDSYDGFGGIFVMSLGFSESFVLEPFSHWLSFNYPNEETAD